MSGLCLYEMVVISHTQWHQLKVKNQFQLCTFGIDIQYRYITFTCMSFLIANDIFMCQFIQKSHLKLMRVKKLNTPKEYEDEYWTGVEPKCSSCDCIAVWELDFHCCTLHVMLLPLQHWLELFSLTSFIASIKLLAWNDDRDLKAQPYKLYYFIASDCMFVWFDNITRFLDIVSLQREQSKFTYAERNDENICFFL